MYRLIGLTIYAMPSLISPCLWFDHQAEEAANFYVSVFRNSKITSVARYGEAGKEIHGRQPGSVMVVSFELDGQSFTALNGGPTFTISPAISFMIECENQEEIDYYWEKLGEGGPIEAQQCGWLQDRFGVSWQVVPKILPKLVCDPTSAASQRAMTAMLQMQKLDIATLEKAYAG